MSIRSVFVTLLAVFAFSQICPAAEERVAFAEWGFSVEIPKPYEKSTVLHSNNTLDCQVFVSGDYAYVVRVTKLPANTLASTYIEQIIQADVKSAPAGTTRRWELDTRQGELFKGLTRPVESDLGEARAIAKLLNGEPGVQSIAMAPVKDEKSPVLSVGVVARESLREQAELRADVLTAFLKFDRLATKPKPADTPPPTPPTPEPPKPPRPAVVQPTPPKPVVKPAPRYTLKKGDIELAGNVTSVAEDRKSLEMSVTSVRMPGESPVKIDPPREKKVLVASLPADVKTGSKVVIAGKNAGVGKPMTAEFVVAGKE